MRAINFQTIINFFLLFVTFKLKGIYTSLHWKISALLNDKIVESITSDLMRINHKLYLVILILCLASISITINLLVNKNIVKITKFINIIISFFCVSVILIIV